MNFETILQNSNVASQLLKAMANEKRLAILCYLNRQGEMTVSELEAVVGLSQSALSQHLARLRAYKMVSTRRHGLNIYYKVSSHEVKGILTALNDLYG